jgi:hypothetical protein
VAATRADVVDAAKTLVAPTGPTEPAVATYVPCRSGTWRIGAATADEKTRDENKVMTHVSSHGDVRWKKR